jgi:hypothetical protein
MSEYNSHAADEVSATFDCEHCQQPVDADWLLVGDNLYETECYHCMKTCSTSIDDFHSNDEYDNYYDR